MPYLDIQGGPGKKTEIFFLHNFYSILTFFPLNLYYHYFMSLTPQKHLSWVKVIKKILKESFLSTLFSLLISFIFCVLFSVTHVFFLVLKLYFCLLLSETEVVIQKRTHRMKEINMKYGGKRVK